MNMTKEKIELFVKYQKGFDDIPSFDNALQELIVEKKKQTHWIWYIIPYDKPSKMYGSTFQLTPNDVDTYVQNEYLRINYISIMYAVHQQLSAIQCCAYDNFIPNHDLVKIYESALFFKTHSSHADINNVCSKIENMLEPYIATLQKQNNMKHVLNNMILSHCKS